ncbi:uncharacterized protein BDR25DRAFT_353143 [Lindgomyces ingoldianus]|uniref:Uncharacterized protein n=1 Tax=Lindgomyces ingoldianus TaxID=673940 RepID=A0ACB6R0X2_9PLEO|nr:uncharacterized protein BDR25DRAFT_353143 [Lindgomyces ingoldianus]KAF2472831.1 hypothetical protein BDR25DRAFT_353143 [Lindgomyces ingoldianus]
MPQLIPCINGLLGTPRKNGVEYCVCTDLSCVTGNQFAGFLISPSCRVSLPSQCSISEPWVTWKQDRGVRRYGPKLRKVTRLPMALTSTCCIKFDQTLLIGFIGAATRVRTTQCLTASVTAIVRFFLRSASEIRGYGRSVPQTAFPSGSSTIRLRLSRQVTSHLSYTFVEQKYQLYYFLLETLSSNEELRPIAIEYGYPNVQVSEIGFKIYCRDYTISPAQNTEKPFTASISQEEPERTGALKWKRPLFDVLLLAKHDTSIP